MLRASCFAFVGIVGTLSLVAACAASEEDANHRPGSGSSASGGGSATGGGINLGGNGASSVGGLGSGGQPPVPMVPCDEATPCEDGNICAGGFCAPDLGPCTTDDDCDGDSYCCGEGCRDDGGDAVCIPYGYGPRGTLNPGCVGEPLEIGVFAPSVQCEWLGPSADDPYPNSKYVLSSPLVADLPNDSGAAAEIVVVTFDGTDGSKSAPGVIRILNGQTCALLESIYDEVDVVRANSTAALADLDNNGTIEIVARRDASGVVAFEWDGAQFVKKWAQEGQSVGQNWDGPSIHDIDDDGLPEVLVELEVYNGQTGERIFDGGNLWETKPFNGMIPVAADLQGDGSVELLFPHIPFVTFANWVSPKWEETGPNTGIMGTHYAVADFGTVGATAADFDFGNLDGVAEMVAVNDDGTVNPVTILTVEGQTVFEVDTADRGGPPTVADFDGDGFPEVAIAGKTRIRVFDPDCIGGAAGCESDGVRWSQATQDASSAQTGVAVFDFEGDGRAEVVYADECFLRVYAGTSGEVLYSAYRTSATWYESPIVADVDRDQNTEIVVNNAYPNACPVGGDGSPYVDPIHKGVRCAADADCIPGGSCADGYCRCMNDNDCDAGLTCVDPIDGTPGSGKVCRATHPNSVDAAGGIRVLRDRLDRWVSSRSIWNQHAYSITNVNDDGTIPSTSDWALNWRQPGMNNFRQNVQGATGYNDFPDITGALSEDTVCVVSGDVVTLTATVCNRGAKAVGADMPATFYQGDPADGQILCVSYTQGPVPVQGCLEVSCAVDAEITGEITMVVNDNGGGGQTTVECNSENNTDHVTIESCVVK